eukprot:82531_1
MQYQYFNWWFALISLALSGCASLAYTQKWFNIIIRGAFIIAVAVLNILLRSFQYLYLAKLEADVTWKHSKEAPGTASVVIHTFIAFSTISECAFDVLQGVILLLGIEYNADVDILIIIGTWIGFSDELFDFIEDSVVMFVDKINETCIFIYCGLLLAMIISEQSIAIYAVSNGLNNIHNIRWIAIGISVFILCVSLLLLWYLIWKIHKDPKLDKGSKLPFSGWFHWTNHYGMEMEIASTPNKNNFSKTSK